MGTSVDGVTTAMLATGTGSTETDAEPLCPSLAAETTTGPAVRAVTRPLPDTVAREASFDVQVTSRFDSAAPTLSSGVATSWSVWPTSSDPAEGVTRTRATGTGRTVTVAVPLRPSLVALIVVEPVAMPTSSPTSDIVPTAALDELQRTTRPASVAPLAAIVDAENCCDCPTSTVALPAAMTTVATGAGAVGPLSPPPHAETRTSKPPKASD